MIHSNSSFAVKPSSIKSLAISLTNGQAAKEQAAKVQAAKEQAAKEQVAQEEAAKEQAAKEQAAKEQAAKEQAAKEQAAKDQAAKEQVAREQAAKEEAAKEQAAKAQAVQQPALVNSTILDVPLINQLSAPKLYNGCEVTSLAMILNYNGYNVTKNQLANNMPRVPLTYQNGLKGNPNVGFVGNMEVGPGYAVYNGPIFALAQRYAGSKAVNLTNSSFANILTQVSQGEPVWVITTETFAPVSDFKSWHTPQGPINITFSEHSVVITGYDENYVYINNPYGQKNQKLNRSQFEEAWEQMGRQAVVIEK